MIDLVSDDETGHTDPAVPPTSHPAPGMDSDTHSEAYGIPPMQSEPRDANVLAPPPPHPYPPHAGTIVNVDGEEVFIPDEQEFDFQAFGLANTDLACDRQIALALSANQSEYPGGGFADDALAHDREISLALGNDQVCTVEDCLQRVLEIFPDISHEYVRTLYYDFDQQGDYEILPGAARLDNIIEQLVSAVSYPKQEKGKKRKREENLLDGNEKYWEQEDRPPVPHFLKGSMQAMLKAEFPDMPMQ